MGRKVSRVAERILVINPNSSASCTAGIALSLAGFHAAGLPRFEVTQLPGGPPAIVTWRDWAGVAEPLCRLVAEQPAAAYIVACVSDPGVDALRTVTARPVFGPLRAAVAAALARADRFGIIAFATPSLQRQRRALQAMGVEGRLLGHIPLNLPMETLTDAVAPRAALCQAARDIAAAGAEAVILGCAGMAGHRAAIEAACGLPVIEPCQAAAALALHAVVASRPEGGRMIRRLALLVLLLAPPAAAVMPEPPGDPQVAEGQRLLESGRYELGLPLLEAALARLPGDPDILTYIAFAHRRRGDVPAAEAAYRAALATNPDHPGALAYQGALFLAQGRRAEAAANLARLTASCAACPEREALARDLAR